MTMCKEISNWAWDLSKGTWRGGQRRKRDVVWVAYRAALFIASFPPFQKGCYCFPNRSETSRGPIVVVMFKIWNGWAANNGHDQGAPTIRRIGFCGARSSVDRIRPYISLSYVARIKSHHRSGSVRCSKFSSLWPNDDHPWRIKSMPWNMKWREARAHWPQPLNLRSPFGTTEQ